MSDAAIVSTDEAPISIKPQERWLRDETGRVKCVICRCGETVYYKGAIHSRLVVPENGTALCKRCRASVRVPVGYVDDEVRLNKC